MADNNVAINGAGSGVSTPINQPSPSGAAGAANGAAPQQREPERPSWLPEKFKNPEDFAKSYGELEGRLSRSSRAETSLKDWEQWGDPKTLNARLNTYVQQQIEKAQTARTQAQQQQVDWDAIEDFANIHPRQFRDAMKAELMRESKDIIDGYYRQAQQEIASIRNDFDQRNKIQQSALLAKISNPELKDVDLNDIYKTMLEIASGNQDSLMGLAVTQLTSGKAREQDQKAIEARVRADMELAERNKAQDGISGILRRFQGTPDRPKGKEQIKASILKQGLEKGLFRPENI